MGRDKKKKKKRQLRKRGREEDLFWLVGMTSDQNNMMVRKHVNSKRSSVQKAPKKRLSTPSFRDLLLLQ